MIGTARDIGAHIVGMVIGAGTATAGGTGDNTEVTGQKIDRDDFMSGAVEIAYKAVLAQAATLTIGVTLQESSDGSTWDTAETIKAAAVVSTGGTGGTTNYGVVEIDIKLEHRKRYIRINVKPDLSAANTDTLVWGGTAVLGGARTVPV